MRHIAISVCALLLIAAGPTHKPSSPQRAVPGAGWSSAPVTGDDGEHICRRYCWACHGDGPDHPGTDALQVKYHGSMPALLHERTDLSAEFIVYTVRHGVSVMPSMRKTEIGDAELAAITTYLTRKRR